MSQKRLLNKIVKQLSPIEDVKVIILYGSIARDDYSSKSDIDLFILTTKKDTYTEIQNKILELDIGRNIQPTIRTRNELVHTDSGLLQNIFQEGKIIYLREPVDIDVSLLLNQKPYLVYTFNLSNLDQKVKAKFNRELYQSKTKTYSYEGLLHKVGGEKLAKGCVLLPYVKKKTIDKLFDKYKVKIDLIKVWK